MGIVSSSPKPQGQCPPPVTDNDYIIPPDNLTNCVPLQAAIRRELFQVVQLNKQGTLRTDFPTKTEFKFGKVDYCPLYQAPNKTKLFPCNMQVYNYCKAYGVPTYTSANACMLDLNRKGGVAPVVVQFTVTSATSTGRSLDVAVGTFATSGLLKAITVNGTMTDVTSGCGTTSLTIFRGTTRVTSKTFTFNRSGTTSVSVPIGVTVNANDRLVLQLIITKAGCTVTVSNTNFICQF